jgi:hypothetical protein
MFRRLVPALAFLAAVGLALSAQDAPKPAAPPLTKVPEGKFTLNYGATSGSMQRLAVVEIAVEDGKPVAKLVSASPNLGGTDLAFGPPTVADGVLKFAVNLGPNKLAFEGKPDPKNPKQFLGTFGDPDRLNRGLLEPTTLEKLTQKDAFVQPPPSEALKAINDLRGAEGKLRVKARQEKDDDAKAKLLAEADEAAKTNAGEITKLQRKLAESGEPFASVQAAQQLLTGAAKANATEADVAAWVKVLEADAAPYGPKIVAQARTTVTTTLVGQEKYGKLALPYALEAAGDKSLTTKGKYAALKLLQRAQVQAGLPGDADATMKRVVALDAELDAEYLKTVPPFKPTKYAGRTDKSANRVAVMELFTGAQCPPCVAADVGFDALVTSYKPADAIFLQYHEHIPGPDPLTNADSVVRMAYYSKLHKDDFRGTPSVAFNGKPAAGGGGGMANAEKKFGEFGEVLAKVLEETTDVTVRGGVKRTGDEFAVTVELTGKKDLDETAVLRLVLVEDTVKYVGGNGLRFHHHVVRSLLGTQKGIKIADLKDGKSATTHDLKALRTDLTKYLDDFAAKGRAFPYPERPMDMKKLKVVALVQNEETGEIVQAAQFDVTE